MRNTISSRPDVLIVGAGLGGLTAALTLANVGCTVTVLETAPSFRELGAGIQISPNGARVLIGLGLGPALDQVAFRPQAGEMRAWKSGALLTRVEMGEAMESRMGAPYLHLHRADLHRVLVNAATAVPNIELVLGAQCQEVLPGPTPEVRTRDGRSFRARLLVGADGIRSAVRGALFGPQAPRFTGCVAWRGLIPVELVAALDIQPVAALWMGPRAHFVHYFVRSGELVNVVAVVEKTGWEVESWTEPGDKAELLGDFEGWHPKVRGLLQALDGEALFKWALFDREPMPTWSRGACTLLGDACHPMLPFMAQGACMAIEDAQVLADCVARWPVEEALSRYAQLRQARTAKVQGTSQKNAGIYHARGPKAFARDLALRLVGARLAARTDVVYGYRAEEVAAPLAR